MKKTPNFEEMIPELTTHLDGKPVDLELWLARIGRYDHAVAYASLIWPQFTEHEGCVFLGPEVPSTYQEWKAKYADNTQAIERMLNHQHILDMFPSSPEPNQALVLFLGKLLQETWAAKLAGEFPDRSFVVEFFDDFDISVDNPSITFYTKNRSNNGINTGR